MRKVKMNKIIVILFVIVILLNSFNPINKDGSDGIGTKHNIQTVLIIDNTIITIYSNYFNTGFEIETNTNKFGCQVHNLYCYNDRLEK
jgi:hypothetical protein